MNKKNRNIGINFFWGNPIIRMKLNRHLSATTRYKKRVGCDFFYSEILYDTKNAMKSREEKDKEVVKVEEDAYRSMKCAMGPWSRSCPGVADQITKRS